MQNIKGIISIKFMNRIFFDVKLVSLPHWQKYQLQDNQQCNNFKQISYSQQMLQIFINYFDYPCLVEKEVEKLFILAVEDNLNNCIYFIIIFAQQVSNNKIIANMTQFSLWYAYYDSIFLNPYPRVSQSFYQDHNIQQITLSVNKRDAQTGKINWPFSVCPNLAMVYQMLQSFIKSSDNWVASKCKEHELESIAEQIDNLVHFLELQKSYSILFWERDFRRIQASIVHFYTFLQLFVRALIPYPTMTLFQCKSANKLCIKIEKLEKLMNQILKCINPIAKILSDAKFKQQRKLVKNFFQNWIYFMKHLPKIKRNKLNHVHKLAKFVCLTNPIQICTSKKNESYLQTRKKSNTVGTKLELRTHPVIQHFKSHVRLGIIEQEETQLQKQKKRVCSCIDFGLKKSKQFFNQLKQTKDVLFHFPDEIVKQARQQEIRNRTMTLESLASLKNKVDKFTKDRTMTTNQTRRMSRLNSSQSPIQIKRHKAKSYYQRKSPSKSPKKRTSNNTISIQKQETRNKRQTRFYQQQSQRNSQILSVRSSKQSTIRKRQLSIMTILMKPNADADGSSHNDNGKYQYLNQQIIIEQNPKMDINTGLVRYTKWDLVRAYFWERVRARRIRRIIEGQ